MGIVVLISWGVFRELPRNAVDATGPSGLARDLDNRIATPLYLARGQAERPSLTNGSCESCHASSASPGRITSHLVSGL